MAAELKAEELDAGDLRERQHLGQGGGAIAAFPVAGICSPTETDPQGAGLQGPRFREEVRTVPLIFELVSAEDGRQLGDAELKIGALDLGFQGQGLREARKGAKERHEAGAA